MRRDLPVLAWVRAGAGAGALSIPLLLALGVDLACKKEEDPAAMAARRQQQKQEIVEKYRALVNEKLARVHVIIDAIDQAPITEEDATARPTSPPIKLRELHWDDEDSNADAMMRWELGRLERGILGTCAFYLRAPIKDEIDPHLIEDVLAGCTRMRWFLVLRPDLRVKPTLAKGENEYSGGIVSGDVLVFDLEGDGRPPLVTSFPLIVELSKPVEVSLNDDKSLKEYTLDEALRKEVLRAIERKIQR